MYLGFEYLKLKSYYKIVNDLKASSVYADKRVSGWTNGWVHLCTSIQLNSRKTRNFDGAEVGGFQKGRGRRMIDRWRGIRYTSHYSFSYLRRTCLLIRRLRPWKIGGTEVSNYLPCNLFARIKGWSRFNDFEDRGKQSIQPILPRTPIPCIAHERV